MPLGEIILWSPQAVVELHMNQSIANDVPELGGISVTAFVSSWIKYWSYKCQ